MRVLVLLSAVAVIIRMYIVCRKSIAEVDYPPCHYRGFITRAGNRTARCVRKGFRPGGNRTKLLNTHVGRGNTASGEKCRASDRARMCVRFLAQCRYIVVRECSSMCKSSAACISKAYFSFFGSGFGTLYALSYMYVKCTRVGRRD